MYYLLLDPAEGMRVLEYTHLSMASEKVDDKAALSAREWEVLAWIKQGKSTADISRRLGITGRTVKFHSSNILQKLGAKTRAHAVAKAMEKDFLK